MNSWPEAIFTELKYATKKKRFFNFTYLIRFLSADHRTLTFHVANNAYRINASNVASSACKFNTKLIVISYIKKNCLLL